MYAVSRVQLPACQCIALSEVSRMYLTGIRLVARVSVSDLHITSDLRQP